jgi:hypothetical protein
LIRRRSRGILLEGHLQSGKEDKVREMVAAVNQYLRREIERLSLNLLELYRRKEQTYYMKEKKQEDLRRLMRNDRFVKMNLERQVEQLERTRRGLIEALVYLNLSEETLQETNSEGFLSDLLTKYLDKKDFVIGMLEDKLLDLLINEVVSHYKQSQIISFNSYCQCLQPALFQEVQFLSGQISDKLFRERQLLHLQQEIIKLHQRPKSHLPQHDGTGL